MFDRDDHKRYVQQKRRRETHDNAAHLQRLDQAAVAMESLTGDANWDLFQRCLQSAIEQTREQRHLMAEKLVDPRETDETVIRYARQQVMLCDERIRAWEVVIGYPKEIIEHGEQARKLLSKLEEA